MKSLCVRAPNNAIARKLLIRLQKLESAATQQHKPAEQRTDLAHNFIEKGGKSCTTTQRQTGDPGLLASGTAGDAVVLTLQDTRVLVRNQHGGYLGSLDPRLARRLRKLISGGNRYSAVVRGTDAQGLSIILRETTQHASMRNVVSFPTGGRQVSASRLPDTYPEGDIPRNPWDADTAPSETPDSQSDVDRENEAATSSRRRQRKIQVTWPMTECRCWKLTRKPTSCPPSRESRIQIGSNPPVATERRFRVATMR